MRSAKRAIRAQLSTISDSLQHKIVTGKLLLSGGEGSFICGAFVAMKREAGFAVLSSRTENDVCDGLILVESAILIAFHMQNNDIMASNYVIGIDALISRHQLAMKEHSGSVKVAIKEKDFERKDIMYSRYLYAKDRVAFYRRKIQSKSDGIVEKR